MKNPHWLIPGLVANNCMVPSWREKSC